MAGPLVEGDDDDGVDTVVDGGPETGRIFAKSRRDDNRTVGVENVEVVDEVDARTEVDDVTVVDDAWTEVDDVTVVDDTLRVVDGNGGFDEVDAIDVRFVDGDVEDNIGNDDVDALWVVARTGFNTGRYSK